jgi:tRNA threonylcarbamoyladenosine biosynthesis protein TsaB
MTEAFSIAIETSGRVGSVTLGRGDRCLASAAMPEQERHRVDLMPTIDGLCTAHGVGPRQIAEVYLSIGPGSFTGLRIGVATAKMLAQALGAKIVAVPTVEVIACNVPAPPPVGATGSLPASVSLSLGAPAPADRPWTLAVCLNLKRDTIYAGRFHWTCKNWVVLEEPRLLTTDDLLALPRPMALVGDPLPPAMREAAHHPPAPEADLAVLPSELALPHSEWVWRLGRARARRGRFADPLALSPLYARPPEAVELWEKRLTTDKRG